MMSNTTTFTLHIRNTVKMARDKMGSVLRVFQSRKPPLMLLLLKSLVIPLLEYCCLLWNLWKTKDIQYKRYRSYSTNVYIQDHWSKALKLLGKLHELKLYSLQRRREHYIIIYILKITLHMVPNIDGTMGHKIKTRKHERLGTQCVIQYPTTETQHNPFKKMQ